MARPEGAHAAYYPDDSGVAIFATELKALRYAVEHSMAYVFWPYGATLNEAVKASHEPEVLTPSKKAPKAADA
jgi:hypothetical protein